MGRLEALLRRCRAGDREALEELIRRWERKLFYYIRRLVADEADAWDILQQTWARVVKGIHTVRDSEKLVSWLYRVARNTTLSHRASLLARERWVDRTAAVEELAGDEIREAQWSAEEVHRGLDTLSAHHRDALTLFFLQDLSIEEMAGVLGVSEGTVKSRLFYGKKALRESLEKLRSRL
jgi:RNA polymerase sigma-70 factor (ECF subfamily)